jgi:hypothetical protein
MAIVDYIDIEGKKVFDKYQYQGKTIENTKKTGKAPKG